MVTGGEIAYTGGRKVKRIPVLELSMPRSFVSWRSHWLWLVLLLPTHSGWIAIVSAAEDPIADTPATPHPAEALRTAADFLEIYCLDCHDAGTREAGLNLEQFAQDAFASSDAEMISDDFDSRLWEDVYKRVASRQMPPPDASRPTDEVYGQSTRAMDNFLAFVARRDVRPGRTETLRRLTRTEYQNAIRDLLAIQIDAETLLPADPSSQGFDNITVGELSPALLGRYLSAAENISRLAVGVTGRVPGGTTIRLPADRSQENHVAGLPWGTKGGALLQHTFPRDGEYEFALRLTRDRDEKVEGLDEQHHVDVLIDRRLAHRFTIDRPKNGNDYTHADSHLRIRIPVTAGPHAIGITFPSKQSSLLEIKRQPFDASYNRHRHPRQTPALFQISIVGPFDPGEAGDTPSRRKIFVCEHGDSSHDHLDPDEAADHLDQSDQQASDCGRLILGSLMRRAYRRPVTEEDLAVPMQFFESGRRDSGFETGIQRGLAAILVNPNFLFRIETDPPGIPSGQAYEIDQFQLASRLAFFLWSSLPDEELLALAEQNQLRSDGVLRHQVRRMLADPRSESLVTNFAAQWLYLRNLESITPDLRLFPDFDDNLRQAFRRESELAVQDVIQNDRSVLRLIDSNTTFLNQRLAKHYGIPQVMGSHFRPVRLSPQTHRGGLLRHGSILMVTSYATRTSPTIRGHWILKNIFGTPPPPPPPNVPNLKERSTLVATSIRQRLAQHRQDPACASCHNLMDPVGFALENYDAVGRWRNFDGDLPIDTVGILPDGFDVSSVADLEAAIVRRPEMFVGTLTEKLMTYALGRGVEHYDQPAIRKIVRAAAENDYRISSVVIGIVESQPFQMRMSQ
jgi:hypothetical protein